MELKQAIKHFGTKAELARKMGVTRQAITGWGDGIPAGRQFQLEVLTGGKLKAERKSA